jgi:tRNA threonylcarbamoyladenosine biosynthesis protein TsaE
MFLDLPDLEATRQLGHALGGLLFPGAVVGLSGPLGAGKTHLVRFIAEGLGVADSRVVSSPTFVLIQEYEGRLPIYHFDVYRLKMVDEFENLGVFEYFEGDGVCLIEWADRVAHVLPDQRLDVELAVVAPTVRRARLVARGEGYEKVVTALGPSLPNLSRLDTPGLSS